MAALAALRRSWQVPARRWKLSSTAARAANWQPCRGHRLSPSDDELYQKTTITMLEKESPDMMFINSYSTDGFVINGDKVIGPCVVFPRVILQWNVGSYKDITEESLALFHMLEPRIEILVVGTGDKVQRLDPAILKFMRQKGVAVEVQDTPNACATFNFLTNERRIAAAGLIPPLYVEKDIV
ncbi:NADH dehydrogenase [ubiquinone] 1 alpha subcomplex assembly factor 3 [Pleurodeles waltl]|uniref:NADH dehydrogenase [ubiquinone] 1 alpha subcomplex assembly factor 3 n=1 Tax=Pleurodeles waltl TaxID=8319 RepID=UPI0037095A3B